MHCRVINPNLKARLWARIIISKHQYPSISIAAFVIPTASFYLSATAIPVITKQSRGMAITLMAVYGLYLYFELRTHADGFNAESRKVPKRTGKHDLPPGAIQKVLVRAGGMAAGPGRPVLEGQPREGQPPDDELMRRIALEDQEDEPEWPQLHLYVCLAILVIGTTILAFNTQFMTDSTQGLTEKAGVPRDFIGMILLPILGNDAMAVQCASKDQMDLAIQSALGKSIQTALVVAPIQVVVGWGMGVDDMNLLFDGFQVSALFVSVLLAQQCILDGKSNWFVFLFLGCMMMS
jgi:Ca2+:H+ antiporter